MILLYLLCIYVTYFYMPHCESVNSLFCEKLLFYTKYKLTYSLRYNNYYSITFGYINFIENWERTSIDKRSSATETSCSWTKQTKGKIV